jgi:hypothetical protein
MATQDRIIDLERSYIPMDPNGFPETMHATGGEDAPEGRIPVICYDGYNFLPTQYGYSSFFGITSKLDVTDLDSRLDDVFIIQTETFVNILVALAEDGIWTKTGSSSGAWSHIITLDIPSGTDVHRNWSKVVIGNEIFAYRQQEENIWRMNPGNSFVPTEDTPTFLNMEGQLGIFKAGGRLGFWDSDGSISWGNPDDAMDQTPSLTSGAGNTKFQQIYGKIVVVHQHGTGFIIYCTKSVVLVARGSDANFFWISEAVFTGNGISYREQVAVGQPDTLHFAYTTFGFAKIENGRAEYVLPEVFSFLKEKKEPVYLKVLEGRFLFLSIIDEDLIFPVVGFSDVEVPALTLTWAEGSAATEVPEESLEEAIVGGNNQEGTHLFRTFGWTSRGQATDPNSVPIWEDHIATVFEMAKMSEWKSYPGANFGSKAYFDGLEYSEGGIPLLLSSGNEYFLPPVLPIETDESAYDHTEDNEFNFFYKQEMAWYAEEAMYGHWKDSILGKTHLTTVTPAVISADSVLEITIEAAAAAVGQDLSDLDFVFGPYVKPYFNSETNRYYGYPGLGSPQAWSAWLQRSNTIGETVTITRKFQLLTVEAEWRNGTIGSFTEFYATYAAAIASGRVTEEIGGSGLRALMLDFGTFTLFPYYPGTDINAGDDPGLDINNPVYFGSVEQYYTSPVFDEVEFENCDLKERGFTKVKSKGHYESDELIDDNGPPFDDEATSLAYIIDITNNTFPSVVDEASLWALYGAGSKAAFLAVFNGSVEPDPTTYFALATAIYDSLNPTNPEAEAADYSDQCEITPIPDPEGAAFNGEPITLNSGFGTNGNVTVTIDDVEYTVGEQLVFPASTFLLQDGSIEPLYPTFAGAFVYDLQYKKWGKMGREYKLLLDYSPINDEAGDKRITAEIFGVFAGMVDEAGDVFLFDKFPEASVMRFGKVGYYRHGFTDCEGINLQFRAGAIGSVSVEASIDGKNIDSSLTVEIPFENVNVVDEGFSLSARWFNIVIQGIFDLKHLEFKGRRKGRR